MDKTIEGLALISFLSSIFLFIIGLIVFFRFMALCSNVHKIRVEICNFTELYYELQKSKINIEK